MFDKYTLITRSTSQEEEEEEEEEEEKKKRRRRRLLSYAQDDDSFGLGQREVENLSRLKHFSFKKEKAMEKILLFFRSSSFASSQHQHQPRVVDPTNDDDSLLPRKKLNRVLKSSRSSFWLRLILN